MQQIPSVWEGTYRDIYIIKAQQKVVKGLVENNPDCTKYGFRMLTYGLTGIDPEPDSKEFLVKYPPGSPKDRR